MKKIKIGITGGIGSGKSELCKYYTEKGEKVIFADIVAKNILSGNKTVQKKIIELFGKDSFEDGNPNLKYLAENIFKNEKNVKKMNSVVHPAAIDEIQKQMRLQLEKSDIVFVESALIYEAGMENLFDFILAISAPDNLRIERVAERDDADPEEIKLRINNQLSEEFKVQNADFVIHNNSTIDELYKKAEFFLDLFKTICTSEI
ncbi:MAG: dephospho-CoA kinase [Ignavibacteria bacterium]|nr:dephospho-CoA kinase [Ignavibacteria bacterium]